MNQIGEKALSGASQTGYSTGYSTLRIRLHWAVVGLLILQWVTSGVMSETLEEIRQGESASAMQFIVSTIHLFSGLTVFVLVCARIRLSILEGMLVAPSTTPDLIKLVGRLTHQLLYLALLLLPITGSLAYFDILPAAAHWHAWVGWVLLLLVLLHTSAAAYHYLVMKDGVAQRMFSRGKSKSGSDSA